nr:MAG TPA: Protein of unknown function (DUF1056) [Caudoviricetes sp.]
MSNPTLLVILFYVLSAISLVVGLFLVHITAGLAALSVALLVPAVILYKELKEGD